MREDFTGYTGKPLQDFMRESNRWQHVLFVAAEEEAIAQLTRWSAFIDCPIEGLAANGVDKQGSAFYNKR